MRALDTPEQTRNATGTAAACRLVARDRESTTDELAVSGPTSSRSEDAVFQIPENLAEAEALFWSIKDQRTQLGKKLEPTDGLRAIVRLADHATDMGIYCLRGREAPVFMTCGDIRSFFEPYLSCDPQRRFARDRAALLEAHAAQAMQVHNMKLEAGTYEMEALDDVLYEQEAAIEDHICSFPCQSIEDVHRKVQFALLVLSSDELDWDGRDKILRSIQSFTAFASGKDDEVAQLTGLQVAALEAVADQLG
ncbi:MAG: hypothetical protein ACK43M_22365 [Allorhizobium sp.]